MRHIDSKIANTILLIVGLIMIALATTALILKSREPDVGQSGIGLAVVLALGFWCAVGAIVNLRINHLR